MFEISTAIVVREKFCFRFLLHKIIFEDNEQKTHRIHFSQAKRFDTVCLRIQLTFQQNALFYFRERKKC